jgi:hypothetical protein
MTIQEIIQQAQRLSLTDQIRLVSQLIQLVEKKLPFTTPKSTSPGTTPQTAEPQFDKTPEKVDFRELSGLLYRPEQPPVSSDAMNAAIEAEAGRLLMS